jgi:aldehyde dehydrogenase (NAD+)
LVEHDGVDKIAFTGSTEVGRLIRKATAGSGKKLSLELGGKSPFIVFEDADLDAAVEGVVDAIWFNQGQVCCAGSRLLIQESIAERFLAKLSRRMETMRVGDPLDKSVDMGAIVDPIQIERIQALVKKGEAEGGQLVQATGPLPDVGCFFAPSFFTNVNTSSTVVQEEIFGPVAAVMTFRTPDEAVQLANHTRYGLAATVWSENINQALDTAARMKAGVVWINSTNLFDAAAGFGGYRESGFGREGGREGILEYLVPGFEVDLKRPTVPKTPPLAMAPGDAVADSGLPSIDRTAKLYIGGKQLRPDSGYSYSVYGAKGKAIGQAGLGNRKDIRNAVEAASKASGWGTATAHNRAQVLYYIAENLSARAAEFERRLRSIGHTPNQAKAEVEATLVRIFYYAAWADKYDGRVHATKSRHVTLAVNEPYGVMGLLCPDGAPLLGFVSLVMPAVAMGNRVVAVPSQCQPLAATDLYQVFDTSDVPDGVINIVTGAREELAKTLAEHDDVAAVWYFGTAEGTSMVESLSAGNLKATWCGNGKHRDWLLPAHGQGDEFLRRATQVKNIWVPYGV